MARKKSQETLAREFGFMWPLFMGLFGLLLTAPKYIGFLPWEAKPNALLPLVTLGVSLCLFSLVFPGLWRLFFRFWMHWLARPLAWVMTRLLLSLFFFLVMTPFVVLLRLSGKKFLDTAWRDGKDSYWIAHDPQESSLERYRKQF